MELCNLSPYITSISGLACTSKSYSDQWIMSAVTQSNESIFLFIKIFVHNLHNTESLQKESDVYNNIITPLATGICPFFIPYYGSGSKCSYLNIINLSNHNIELKNKIIRNLYFIFVNTKKIGDRTRSEHEFMIRYPIRPKLDIALFAEDTISIMETTLERLTFNYTILQKVPDNTQTLEIIIIKPLVYGIIFEILFQIIYTIMVLHKCHLCHNDLYFRNIYITKLETPIRMFFVINGHNFVFDTLYKVMIFDFDQAIITTLDQYKYTDMNFEVSKYIPPYMLQSNGVFFDYPIILGKIYEQIPKVVEMCSSNCILSIYDPSYFVTNYTNYRIQMDIVRQIFHTYTELFRIHPSNPFTLTQLRRNYLL